MKAVESGSSGGAHALLVAGIVLQKLQGCEMRPEAAEAAFSMPEGNGNRWNISPGCWRASWLGLSIQLWPQSLQSGALRVGVRSAWNAARSS
jgi:hypothetical protein